MEEEVGANLGCLRHKVGIMGSNPAEGMNVRCVGSSLCSEMITCSEEPCWVCVS